MSLPPRTLHKRSLEPERVAYWYFRLNGFLQIENFIVHPESHGSQRTDADLLGVRFPYRAERLIDDPEPHMKDDETGLALTNKLVDVVIAEVKQGRCHLNSPWTNPSRRNIERVLAALGCLPHHTIEEGAEALYASGLFENENLRIRLLAIGRDKSDELKKLKPRVVQIVWYEVLSFLWRRFHDYRNQKTQVDQWSVDGKELKAFAESFDSSDQFTTLALQRMGIDSSI